MKRIAVIFDNRVRPETTGLYCRRALEELVQAGQLIEVKHFLPEHCDRIPANHFDLFLFVDDGMQSQIPQHLKPAVWWAIDTHLNYERTLSMARDADWSFAAQRSGVKRLLSDGITNAVWLPLACDPAIHGKRPTDIQFDLCFIGTRFVGERENLLNQIQDRYSNIFIGNKYFEEMAQTYSASRIVFNRSLADDINMRVFEGLCSGTLLLTNALSEAGQEDLFQEGIHLETYTQAQYLWEKIDYYLKHDQQRCQIAEQGRLEVLKNHTYRHRMETILKTIALQSSHGTQVSSRHSESDRTSIKSRLAIASKPVDYFEYSRPDVLDLIPQTAQRILDIGCGGGHLGLTIKNRQQAYVAGVEYDAVTAQRARSRLDEVQVGDIESGEINFQDDEFDCVICADVLEHLRNPESLLKRIRRWLTPEGVLVTSLPNVRNHTVIRSLLAGNWTYESAGLLDNDHVRFFTRREIEKLLFRTGFTVEEMQMVGGEGYAEWLKQDQPAELSIGGLQIKTSSPEEAAEFFAYQYLTRSKVNKAPEYGKTSIIIVTYNQSEYTRQCVESILLRTDESYELIFVDNASSDGTTQYLDSLEGATVICNETNRGFPAAVNQGIQIATGDQILLLNNDTILTTGWLQRMLNVLYSNERVGLVGPVSNNISGPQQIAVTYQHLNELDGFAWDWGKQHLCQVREVERLVGFCLLCKREVIERIGLLDERFGIGNFEDDDFCRRARQAGYQRLIALDSFVHHYGSVSFQGAGIDLNQVLQENQKLYREKWEGGPTQSEAMTPAVEAVHESFALGKRRPQFTIETTSEGLRLQSNAIKLSACLIVRDNEKTIRPCLETLKPWVDEIVVVDTGSKDATPEICKELGARVFHWPWRDDFSAARNESINHARGEWIFWLDSDDTIPEHCGKRLRELVDGNHSENIFGYVAQVHCPGTDSKDITVVDHVKLFRNRPDLRFEFRIHEQIIPSIRKAGGEVAWTDIYVVHSGSDQTEKGRAGKLVRDFRLLEKELADRPHHPFVLFNLGMTHADAKQYEPAVEYLKHCIEVTGLGESHLCKAYALLVNALSQLNNNEQAWDVVTDGLKLFPNDKELMFRQALLQHHFGNLKEAAKTYLRILNEKTDRKFASVDQGISNFKARHNLAVVYEDAGRPQEAEQQWRMITDQYPDYLPAWRGLGENLLTQGKQEELQNSIQSLPEKEEFELTRNYFLGKLAIQSQNIKRARKYFEAAMQIDPNDISTLNELCRLHFENGNLIDSQQYLQQLISIDPENPSAHTNMGMVLLAQQKYEAAAEAFKTSLLYRPAHKEVKQYLARCYEHAT